MKFKISPHVREKLQGRDISLQQVIECFMNREGPSFKDERAIHQTDPMTQWFIAETDCGKKLKVVYIQYDDAFAIKSAFPANAKWSEIYIELCGKHS